MAVRQCPRCELRFEAEWELVEHLRADHGIEDAKDLFGQTGGPGPDPPAH